MLKHILLITLSFLIFTGCSDSEEETTTKLNIQAGTKSRAPITIIDSEGNSFILSVAKIGVRHVQFETADDSSYTIEGPFVVDLMAGSTPNIASTEVPAGEYARVDVRIDDTDDDFTSLESFDPLFSYSLYGRGTYDGKVFEIKLKFNEDIRFDFDSPIRISEGETNTFTLNLQASEWFAQLDLTDCIDELSGDDTLIISDESGACSEVEGALKTAIKTMYDMDKI